MVGWFQSCDSYRSSRWRRRSTARTGWLKRRPTTIGLSKRSFRRYQFVASSLTVGVVNAKEWAAASFRPLIAVAEASMVTVYRVENGRATFGSGVKIRIVVPDQRKVPGIAGWILKNGAETESGIRPNLTIGSEKTTVISRDSPRSEV